MIDDERKAKLESVKEWANGLPRPMSEPVRWLIYEVGRLEERQDQVLQFLRRLRTFGIDAFDQTEVETLTHMLEDRK